MRTLLSGLLVLLFIAPASAAVNVKVSSPATGATVTDSFTVSASATTSRHHYITGWYVYVDGIAAWNTPGPASSISAPLTVTTGSHQVAVRAWDNTGAYGTAYLSVTATDPITTTTVTVQSPVNGANVTDPVTFTASATSPNGISGWVIYMDNQNVYQVDNYSNTLTASVNLPAGTHSIYIRAWDNITGYGTSPTFTINVSSTGVLPTPPANATVWSQVEDSTDGWWDCSDCAGGTVTTNYWTAPFQTTPSMDGSSRQFYNGGQGWADTLWVKKFGAQNYASHFLWDFYVYFDSTTASTLWSAEYDLWQSIGGYEFMIGSQCAFGDGVWDTWDQLHGYWVHTSIACPRFAPNTWHHIQYYLERPSSTQYKYVTLVVDGVAYSINQTYNASVSNWDDSFGVQWQLDLGSAGTPANEWIDQVNVTIW